jgi:hypothetical protein
MCVVQKQLKEIEEESQISYEGFKSYCTRFCETCIEYIQELCVLFLAPLQSVDRMSSKKVPDWNNIVSIKWLSRIFTMVEEELFNEYFCVRKYCEGKLKEWIENSVLYPFPLTI